MNALMAVTVGFLYASSVYLMLRRSLFKLIIGLVLLSHGANLLIFTAGGLRRAQPPVLPPNQTTFEIPAADPLPQALILTAIVIGFGVLAFALVLFSRAYQVTHSDDTDEFWKPEI